MNTNISIYLFSSVCMLFYYSYIINKVSLQIREKLYFSYDLLRLKRITIKIKAKSITIPAREVITNVLE